MVDHAQQASDAAADFAGSDDWLDQGRDLPQPMLLSDHVYALLRRAIVEGRIAPGERIVESKIAKRLGISQAPVRDAVKRLVHDGIVSHVPRRGNHVTEVFKEDATQARQVRVALEELAARLAVDRVTDRDRAGLSELVSQLREAAVSDLGRFRDLDIAFHRRVCEISGNKYLVQLWSSMEPTLRGLRAISDPLYEGDWASMAEEHARLLEALCSGDAARAGALFAAHAIGPIPIEEAAQ